MKTKTRISFLARAAAVLAFMLTSIVEISAQTYEVFPFRQSKKHHSAAVYKYIEPKQDNKGNFSISEAAMTEAKLKKDTTELQMGTLVMLKDKGIICYTASGFFQFFNPDRRMLASIEYEGNAYLMDPRELKFSAENPEGTENPIASYTDIDEESRSFYGGMFYVLIFLFIFLMWRFSRRAALIGISRAEEDGGLKPYNWLIGLMLFLALGVGGLLVEGEIECLVKLGSDFCWIFNTSYVNDLLVILITIMLYFALRWQWGTIHAFAVGLQCFVGTKEPLPTKRVIWSIVIAAIVALLILVLIMMFRDNAAVSSYGEYAILVVPSIVVLLAVISVILEAQKTAGWTLAVIYALFLVIWSVGTLVVVGAFVYQIVKIIIPFIILALFTNVIGSLKLDKPSAPMLWYDKNGMAHSSQYQRDLRN